jgi:hypothetical protein
MGLKLVEVLGIIGGSEEALEVVTGGVHVEI